MLVQFSETASQLVFIAEGPADLATIAKIQKIAETTGVPRGVLIGADGRAFVLAVDWDRRRTPAAAVKPAAAKPSDKKDAQPEN